MDIGYTDGLVVLRKRVPLSSAQVRTMLVGGNDLPELAPTDEQEVAAVVTEARKARRRRKGAD